MDNQLHIVNRIHILDETSKISLEITETDTSFVTRLDQTVYDRKIHCVVLSVSLGETQLLFIMNEEIES
jgi:hypothetical protein